MSKRLFDTYFKYTFIAIKVCTGEIEKDTETNRM